MPLSPGGVRSFSGILRAKIVLPVVGPPLENGALSIADGQITEVGGFRDLRKGTVAPVLDLGEVILAPGLVNAHCHLDYTDMAGQITPPKRFSDWIKALLALKAHWTYSDFAMSWIRGARMLAQYGVTTVANIEAAPELLPEVRSTTPLRLCSLLEMTGVRSRRSPSEIVLEAMNRIDSLPSAMNWAGLSPHAPYSTTRELVRFGAAVCRERGWILSIHVGESKEEYDMFKSGTGPMFEWLKSQREVSDCGQASPVAWLHSLGALGSNLIAIHVNYLDTGDASLLGAGSVSVAHCPRSHAYFQHQAFPCKDLWAAGVNICLGTDSLASIDVKPNEEFVLDLRAEMRAMAQVDPSLAPRRIFELGTINGARALGMTGRLGQLSPGACADLITIPLAGTSRDYFERMIYDQNPVAASMIGGRWIIEPQSV